MYLTFACVVAAAGAGTGTDSAPTLRQCDDTPVCERFWCPQYMGWVPEHNITYFSVALGYPNSPANANDFPVAMYGSFMSHASASDWVPNFTLTPCPKQVRSDEATVFLSTRAMLQLHSVRHSSYRSISAPFPTWSQIMNLFAHGRLQVGRAGSGWRRAPDAGGITRRLHGHL